MINEKQVIQFLKEKDQDYIRNLLVMVSKSKTDIDQNSNLKSCPFCGSISIKKNGKNSFDQQRYFCNDCHKSFSDSTGTLTFYSHFTKSQWLQFIDYELSGMTLADEAHFMDTTVTTCFYMRHKLYKAASEIVQKQKLSEEVEMDAEYLNINLKGTKPENMPRLSKKRSKQAAFRGISHHKICVVCAIDSHDHIMMNIVGLGPESFEKYMSVIERLDHVDKLISDAKTCFRQFSNELNAKHSYIKTSPVKKHFLTEEGESLASVNELMSEVEAVIHRTHGFSTRYAQEYLDFNILKNKSDIRQKEKIMLINFMRKSKIASISKEH